MNQTSVTEYHGIDFLRLVPPLINDPLRTLLDVSARGGPVISFSFAGQYLYLINHPAHIKYILTGNPQNYTRGKALDDIRPLIGNGLFTSDEEYWSGQRRMQQPVFYSRHFETWEHFSRQEVDALKSEWTKRQTSIDLQHEMKCLLLKIQVKALLSPDYSFDTGNVINALDIITQHASLRNHVVNIFSEPLRKLFGDDLFQGTKLKAAFHGVETFEQNLVAKARNKEIACSELLRVLLDAYESGSISRKQLRDDIMTFLFAGFDTVAECLVWTLFLLSQNSSAEEKVLRESHELFNGAMPQIAGLTALPYLNNVINESLRLYPSAWAFFRINLHEDSLGGFSLPGNSYLMISPYLVHRHPEFWDKPDAFIPERFDHEIDELTGYKYIPFGHGKHVCIGKRMALIETALLVSSIIQSFHLRLVSSPNPKVVPGIIIKAAERMMFVVEPRKKRPRA